MINWRKRKTTQAETMVGTKRTDEKSGRVWDPKHDAQRRNESEKKMQLEM